MDYFKNCEIIVEEDDLVCSKSDYHKVIEAWILRYNYTFIKFFLVLLKGYCCKPGHTALLDCFKTCKKCMGF